MNPHELKTTSSRLKSTEVLTQDKDYKRVKVTGNSKDLVSKIEFDIESDSAGTYKCRGTQYDEFCATQQKFESKGVVLSVINAVPLENPKSATGYGGGSHTFSCKFPNPFVGQTYETVWSFKGAGDSIAKVCDYYIVGKYVRSVKLHTEIQTLLAIVPRIKLVRQLKFLYN